MHGTVAPERGRGRTFPPGGDVMDPQHYGAQSRAEPGLSPHPDPPSDPFLPPAPSVPAPPQSPSTALVPRPPDRIDDLWLATS
jgi:hypothetical protein